MFIPKIRFAGGASVFGDEIDPKNGLLLVCPKIEGVQLFETVRVEELLIDVLSGFMASVEEIPKENDLVTPMAGLNVEILETSSFLVPFSALGPPFCAPQQTHLSA